MTAPVAILTRPEGQAQALAQALAAAGWAPQCWPALALAPLVVTALPDVGAFDIVMFVSGNAVRHFAAQRQAAGQVVWPATVRCAVVGPASAAAVRQVFGAETPLLMPPADAQQFDSEALWAVLAPQVHAGARVLVVRGGREAGAGEGRGWLAAQAQAAGASVTLHAAYQRLPACWPAERWAEVRQWQADGREMAWLITSVEGLEALVSGQPELWLLWCGNRVIVTHPRIGARLHQLAADAGVLVRPYIRRGAAYPPQTIMLQEAQPHDDAVLAAFVH